MATPSKMQFPGSGSEVIELDILSMSNAQLLDLIKRWDLRVAKRNKSSYIQSLSQFSNDREAWTLKRPITIRNHKGPRQNGSTTKKHTKSYTKRLEKILSHNPNSQRTTSQLHDTRITGEVVGLKTWARNFLNLSASKSLIPPESTPSSPVKAPGTLEQCPLQTQSATSHSVRTPDSVHNVVAEVSSGLARNFADAPQNQNAIQQANSGQPRPSDRTGYNRDACRPNKTYSLRLVHSQITFTPADIPDPPVITITHDLAKLERIWDDSSPLWKNESPLLIRGHSIALIHWPKVYCYRGTKQWTGIKQRWSEWQMIVTKYQALGQELFWSMYSKDGEHLPVTVILSMVKADRLEDAKSIAKRAKEEYGREFEEKFSYRKSGESVKHVMEKPYAIARKYHLLKKTSST